MFNRLYEVFQIEQKKCAMIYLYGDKVNMAFMSKEKT